MCCASSLPLPGYYWCQTQCCPRRRGVHVKLDRGPGELTVVGWNHGYNIMLAGPHARREPHGQTQKLVPHSVSMLADLYEVAHGVDTAARFDLHSAMESILQVVQYG
jgi:hypothetical protein